MDTKNFDHTIICDEIQFAERMNHLASQGTDFLFIANYEKTAFEIIPLSELNADEILFSTENLNNIPDTADQVKQSANFSKYPVSFGEFEKGFNVVMDNLKFGNSYLTNYTCETPIETNLSLKEIFLKSNARYKLWYKDQFVVFSPEIFVKIKENKIRSFPMKGTIDAAIVDAKEKLLANPKEMAEHATIVDLIRNDLAIVSKQVIVTKYRYFDLIQTNNKALWQLSSEITGTLPTGFENNLGNIILSLLPAGSISGAPKEKTCEIIKLAETRPRGFYTGVFGVYSKGELDCGVMIRFIEKRAEKFYYQSGGGITVNSNAFDEYNEMIDKVYLPI